MGGGIRKKGAEGTPPFFITRAEGTQGFSFVNNDLFPLSPITLGNGKIRGHRSWLALLMTGMAQAEAGGSCVQLLGDDDGKAGTEILLRV